MTKRASPEQNPDIDDELEEDRMTAEEFAQARRDLGLSQRQLAYVLGTSERSIRKWESPDKFGPNPVAVRVVLWILEDGFQPPELLEVRSEAMGAVAASSL